MQKYPRYDRDSGISEVLAQTRELVRQTSQLLRDPLPDTFLGRKTQKPLSLEEKDAH